MPTGNCHTPVNYIIDDSIIRQRLDEHSIVLVPSTSSVTKCTDSTIVFFHALENSDPKL